ESAGSAATGCPVRVAPVLRVVRPPSAGGIVGDLPFQDWSEKLPNDPFRGEHERSEYAAVGDKGHVVDVVARMQVGEIGRHLTVEDRRGVGLGDRDVTGASPAPDVLPDPL